MLLTPPAGQPISRAPELEPVKLILQEKKSKFKRKIVFFPVSLISSARSESSKI
jgi:hypothetical protein